MTPTNETIGAAIRAAREARPEPMTQSDLGAAVDLGKDTISRIEKGERAVKSFELFAIAEALGTTTGRLLGHDERVSGRLALAARLSQPANGAGIPAPKQRIIEILEADDTLDKLIGPEPARPRPQVAVATAGVPTSRGRALAEGLRNALHLGAGPIGNLDALAETYFRAHVLAEPLDGGLDGCAAGFGDADGVVVVMVNSSDHPSKQLFTLAHELGHLVAGDLGDWEEARDVGRAVANKPAKETQADSFAAHFLVPHTGLADVVAGRRVDAVVVGEVLRTFGVSFPVALNRLQGDGFIDGEQREELERSSSYGDAMIAAGGSSERAAAAQRQGQVRPPQRLASRAVQAWAQRKVGLGLVASVFGIDDLNEVRALVERSVAEAAAAH